VIRVLLLFAAILVSGCASYSHFDIDLDNAATELREGDVVRIERKDNTTAHIKIEKISAAEISGSLRTSIFLRDTTIPFGDIVSITRYTRDSFESELPTIISALFLAVIVVGAIF
jgi:DNA-directed RNA polymerase subunit H (RpoH/RPB5)